MTEPTSALTLLLVRHGITSWNAEERLQGQTDIPLSDEGREQAIRLGRRLRTVWTAFPDGSGPLPGPPDAVYTSDLSRAKETADLLLNHALGTRKTFPPVHNLPELRERSFGKFEGLTAGEAQANFPGETHHHAGETHAAVQERMVCALARVWEDCAHSVEKKPGLALVCGHGGSLRLLFSWVLGTGLDGARHFHLDNTGVSVLQFRGPTLESAHGRLRLLNDTAHLSPL